jgi:hypothetical protein
MEMMAALSLPELPGACAAILTLLVPSCGRGAAEGEAALAVAEPRLDFGRVFEGRILEHEWELRVRSPLAVSAAKTDCGCTLAQLERARPDGRATYELGTPLAAGERLFVRARYDTRGRLGQAPRAVTLSLSGGQALALTLVARVEPWLIVDPEELPFQRVLEGQGAECAFEVRSATGASFALRSTGLALPSWVALELTPADPDPDGRARLWRAHARLGPEAPRGTYHYPLEVASDEPVPAASSPVGERFFSTAPGWRLQVVGPVALSSPNLEFGLVHANETVAQSVRLESFDPGFMPDAATARLEPIRPGEPFPLGKTARVHTRPAGRACDIELVLAGLDEEVAGTFLAKLVVETGHPALPRLEALVRGVRVPGDEAR